MKIKNCRVPLFLFVLPLLSSCGPIHILKSDTKAITSYSFAGPAATGIIDEGAKTISVTVPHGTAVTGLVARFTASGTSVKVGDALQVSNKTPNDLSEPVEYAVTAENGSIALYMVTVSIAPQSAKAIGSHSLAGPAAAGSEETRH
jgi:hypothetical protein